MDSKNTNTRTRAKKLNTGSGKAVYSPAEITLKILSSMGVTRGVRFLDKFGKFMFGPQRRTYSS